MKKRLVMSIIAIMVLSACGSNSTNSQPTATATNSENVQSESTKDEDKVPVVETEEAEEEFIDGDLVGVADYDPNWDASEIDPTDIDSFIGVVGMGMKDLVLAYLDAGVNIDAENEYGANAFSTAIIYEEVEVAQLLLDRGAQINYQNSGYYTPLISATDMGLTNMVEFLLENGADPNIGAGDNMDYYPIISAAFLGHSDIVKLLLSHDAYPNLEYQYLGETVNASLLAEQFGYSEIVELIAQE